MFDQSLLKTKKVGNVKAKKERSGNIYLWIKLKHQKKYQATGLHDTPENRRIAEMVLKKAHQDYMTDLNKPKQLQVEDENNIILQKLILRFIDFKKSSVSKGQIEMYQQAFKKVFRGNNYDVRIKHENGKKSTYILESDLKMFVDGGRGLSGIKLKPSTINNQIREIQTFCNYLFDENLIPDKISLNKYFQKETEKEPDPYTEEEMQMILDYAKNNLKNYEIYLWLKFLSLTGSRGGESLLLTWDDVDFKNQKIRFVNKINKMENEMFHISKSLAILLDDIKSFQESVGYTGGKLFRYQRTSVRFLYKHLINIQKKLNIRHNGRGVHGIRRYFLSRVFRADIPMTVMSALCRHKDLNLTKKLYNKFNDSVFDDAYEKIGL